MSQTWVHYQICNRLNMDGILIPQGFPCSTLEEAEAKLARYQYLPAYQGAWIVEVVSTRCDGKREGSSPTKYGALRSV